MLLLKILGCMILAAIIENILLNFALKFFEWRFLRKAETICFLYDSVYQFIDNDFEDDNLIQIGVKYKHRKVKIKFHSALEVSLQIELLVQKAMKDYKIARFLDGTENLIVKFEIDEAKEYMEEMCSEMRNIINRNRQDVQQKEL